MSVTDVARSPIHYQGQLGPCFGESILIYLTVEGAVSPMRVLESDSIASVKLRIQTCKGFVVKKQKLVFAGRELARNDTPIKDYGVTSGNVLHLVLRLSDLLFIVVRTTCGKEFEFHIDRHRNVGHLKQRIKRKGKDFLDLDLFCNGEKLDDQRVFDDVCKKEEDVIHLLVEKSSAKVRATPVEKDLELSIVRASESEFGLEPIISGNPKMKMKELGVMWEMMKWTYEGLKKGKRPIRSAEGSGGTYFMQDARGEEYVSVFKPIDEEPMAENNPQGLPTSSNGEGLKIGTKVGGGAVREVAAYILDHPRSGEDEEEAIMGFSGVPPTLMVKCLHPGFNHPLGYNASSHNLKIGSLQMFIDNDGNCEDIGPGAFPVDQVHKITVLDIRMANTDRHAGNILYKKDARTNSITLIPIDHGYCLPAKVINQPTIFTYFTIYI